MSECLRVIENACALISKVTAPQHWRAPHLLQASLNSLRDAVTTAHEALDMFVDGTGRIAIDRKNPKAEELDGLLKPLLDTKNHLASLRKSLDSAGWTVSVLSRDSESSRSMDALEQFIAALHKAPSDCRRFLQWTQLLAPSPTVVFLSPMSNIKPELPKPINTSPPRMPERSSNSLGSPPFLDETKRLSSSSTSTVTSSDSSQPSSILDRQLVRFYAPQLDQHTESLSLAVEEFLGTVENSLPPREFVQKGKLIILAAHKLIYIGDTVSQCVSDQAASNSLRQCADRLCELLKECVKATKLASEEYPELKSMQGMVDSIIAVSKTAHEMKLLVKRWC
ncbi:hypothetical protein ANCCAN_23941 [Ancylostoma caninum]|uniref:CAS family C-terminal domain-containing protein n=1 Tax=Ancylostoma caninum TaxID=29170 RepID=A0A368FH19_ANCCA|nr:hypothetical protein ANCCAN_23941 [Ancylostoma caninum]